MPNEPAPQPRIFRTVLADIHLWVPLGVLIAGLILLTFLG
jgi:hypothetical protein